MSDSQSDAHARSLKEAEGVVVVESNLDFGGRRDVDGAAGDFGTHDRGHLMLVLMQGDFSAAEVLDTESNAAQALKIAAVHEPGHCRRRVMLLL